MNEKFGYREIAPQDETLKKYIHLYYVHSSDDEQAQEVITYYPNYVTTINIYQNSKVSWNKLSRTHEYDPETGFLKLLVAKFDLSRKIITKGRFSKLTIVFHPLGINHFLTVPLSKLIKPHFSHFTHYGPEFDQLLTEVFETEALEKKRDILDDFFRKQYVGFPEKRLPVIVEKILENNGELSIQDTAEKLRISRKTILRLFRKHLSYSPTEYKSVVRFRKALIAYQNQSVKPRLSALAYEASYYDQSDLNFHFKAKTGLTPQQLFSQIQTIKKGLYWKIDRVP